MMICTSCGFPVDLNDAAIEPANLTTGEPARYRHQDCARRITPPAIAPNGSTGVIRVSGITAA